MSVERGRGEAKRGNLTWRDVLLGMVVMIILLLAMAAIMGAIRAIVESGRVQPVPRTSSDDLVWVRRETVDVTTSGTAANANTARALHGRIYAVHLDYGASISATTDITLTVSDPALTILQVSNTYTDGWYYPVAQRHSSAGAEVSDYAPFVATGPVTIAAGQTTSGTQVLTATILWGQ